MEVGGLGGWEIIVVVTVFLLVFGVPVVAIVALVLFFNRRKRSNPSIKKCAFWRLLDPPWEPQSVNSAAEKQDNESGLNIPSVSQLCYPLLSQMIEIPYPVIRVRQCAARPRK